MKRWNFGGQPGSHGTERKHRSPGGIGGGQGTRGHGRAISRARRWPATWATSACTAQNLALVGVDKEKHLMLIKGTVPGRQWRAGVCASGQDDHQQRRRVTEINGDAGENEATKLKLMRNEP